MNRFVLLPTDFSPLAATAIPLAEELARGLELPIRLLHTVDLTRINLRPDLPDDSTFTMRATTEQALANAAVGLSKASGLRYQPVLRELRAGTAIAREANEGAAVVVMASHGRTGLRRLWMGSVARRVLHSCEAPLLIVNRGAPRPIRRVLFATDTAELAESALEQILPILRVWDAPVELYHADLGPGPPPMTPDQMSYPAARMDDVPRHAMIRGRLAALANLARRAEVEVSTFFEDSERAAPGIWA